MRYALISDIHANLPALEAVLDDIGVRSGVDAVYHLGDLVGYAPWPNETVDLSRARFILARLAVAMRASDLPDEFAAYIETGGKLTPAR